MIFWGLFEYLLHGAPLEWLSIVLPIVVPVGMFVFLFTRFYKSYQSEEEGTIGSLSQVVLQSLAWTGTIVGADIALSFYQAL